MAPYTPPFLPHQLPDEVRKTAKGVRNKELPIDFDLKRDCKLQQMWQYECLDVEDEGRTREGKPRLIRCEPIQRLFRRCQNGMLVETTRWEGERQDIRAVKDTSGSNQ